MATRNHKRSSILKKRPSLASGSSNESSPTQSLPKISKKINFSVKNNVKEFTTQDERNTIWVTSYEESAERYSNAHSADDNNTLHPFLHQKFTCSRLVETTKSSFSEQDKENDIIPRLPPMVERRHISSQYHNSVDMSLTMEDHEASKLKRTQNLSTCDNTMHVLSDLQRLNKHDARPTIQEEDMDLTGDQHLEANAQKSPGKVRSPRKTIFFHQPLNLSVSIEDSVQLCDTKKAPPVSERVIFSSNPIASKFPASFTRRLKQVAEDDMSFDSYFGPEKSVAMPKSEDSNAMNVSAVTGGVEVKSPVKARASRHTIHFEQQNNIEETLLPEADEDGKNTPFVEDDMSIGSYVQAEESNVLPQSLESTHAMHVSTMGGDSQKSSLNNQKNRYTIHFEQNNQLEETILPPLNMELERVELKTREIPVRTTRNKSRETVYLNEDIDTATISDLLQRPEQKLGRVYVGRKTLNLYEDVEKSTETIVEPVVQPTKKRQTIYCNETINDTNVANPEHYDVGRTTKSFDDMSLADVINVKNDSTEVTKTGSEAEMNFTEHPPTLDSNSKLNHRKTVYDAVDMQSESSLAPNCEKLPNLSNTCQGNVPQPHRTILYDMLDNLDQSVRPVNQAHEDSVMDVALESDEGDEKQRLSARRTIMFDDNTVKATIETDDLSALQPLPNMSAMETSCSINMLVSEVNVAPLEVTHNEVSMEQPSDTFGPEAVQESFTNEVDICRAVPCLESMGKSLRIPEKQCDGEKSMNKIATPSKIPIAKHRLAVVADHSDSIKQQQTFVIDVPEALLENESEPCVDPPEDEQQTTNSSSTRTANFEIFCERYLNLTMPRLSDANHANGTLKPRQSFGSLTSLMNYSAPSAECSAILDEIKEKMRNYRPSDETPNSSIMKKGKAVFDWAEFNAKIAKIQIRRAPLNDMMADMKSKIDQLKRLTKCDTVGEVPEGDTGDESVGAIFPIAPSFTSLWQNLAKNKTVNQADCEYEIATIYPHNETLSYLLKNKIVTEMKSWVLDDMFFNSGLLELHNKLLKTVKLRLYFNKSAEEGEITSPAVIKRARFMESHNVHLIRKSKHHRLIHLEFLYRHPFDTPPVIATNELIGFLEQIQAELKAIDEKVERLFRICECFEVDIVEKTLQLLLHKDYGDLLCEITLLDSGGNSNLSGIPQTSIRLCPEMPEIMNKLVKYSGLELLEVLFYELDKLKYQ